MNKLIVIIMLFLLAGCSIERPTEDNGQNGFQNNDTVEKEENNTATSGKESNSSTSSIINIGRGGIDPNRPRDTAEYVKSYFYIEEDIVNRDDYPDNRERLLIGAHNIIVINKDGYIDSIVFPNLNKNEVENLFEDLNVPMKSPFDEVFEKMESVNFEEESGSLSKLEMVDGVLVGLKNNTSFDVQHSGRDKPFSVILAFDEDTIEQLTEQDHF